MSRFLPLLPVLAVILILNACGGGGCGESPQTSQKEAAAPAASKAGGPGGGQPADLSYFDSKKNPAKVAPQGGGAPDLMQTTPTPPPPSRLPGKLNAPRADWLPMVEPGEWRDKVLRQGGPVLVMASEAGCPDCALAGTALKWLSTTDFKDWKFWRIDTADPDAAGVLPASLAGARPGFAIYQDGKTMSALPRLPFKRSPASETDNDYRKRLYNWFKDALSQKDLSFGQRR